MYCKDGESCAKTTKIQDCDANEQCLTKTFNETFNGGLRKRFIKRCADRWEDYNLTVVRYLSFPFYTSKYHN